MLRTNIIASYAGQLWMALIGVLFVPFYVRTLGVEAFGLIALMLSMQALSSVLELGLGGALNRELARRARTNPSSIANLIRSLEWLIWPASIMVASIIWFLSDPISYSWLHLTKLSSASASSAIALMGLAIALQWPSSFYSSGLSGLECLPALNFINAFFATARAVSAFLVLFFVSPSIFAFLWCYAISGALQSATLAVMLWRSLPVKSTVRPHFVLKELHTVGRFTGGLFIISALTVAVSQLDRITLSAFRPLIELGYFSLALNVAMGLSRMSQAMFVAVYPRYSRLVAVNDEVQLHHLYQISCQCMAIVMGSVGAILIVFSHDVIFLWTSDPIAAAKLSVPLSVLAAGTALSGMMSLPYALQLAHGRTRLTALLNLTALILGIPFCIIAVSRYGMVGAASFWLAINIGFIVVGLPLLHRRVFPGHLRHWYIDTLPPVLAALFCALIAGLLSSPLHRSLSGLSILIAISFSTLIVSLLSAPYGRHLVRALGAATPSLRSSNLIPRSGV
jgi:O-antigen/teichoic acid export membrane protein